MNPIITSSKAESFGIPHPAWLIRQEVLAKRSCMAILPAGKSALAHYYPLLVNTEGLVIIVGYHRNYLQEQYRQTNLCGVTALFLHEEMDQEDKNEFLDVFFSRQFKALFITSEKLFGSEEALLHRLKKCRPSLFILEGGEKFIQTTPVCKVAHELKQLYPGTPVLTIMHKNCIHHRIEFRSLFDNQKCQEIQGNLELEGLKLSVELRYRPYDYLHSYQQHYPNHQILWLSSRSSLPESVLSRQTTRYCLTDHLEYYIRERYELVVIEGLPDSLEQLTDILGRIHAMNGQATVKLFYRPEASKRLIQDHYRLMHYEILQAEERLRRLMEFVNYNGCRKKYLRRYFGEKDVPELCGECDICLRKREGVFLNPGEQGILTLISSNETGLTWKELVQEVNAEKTEGNYMDHGEVESNWRQDGYRLRRIVRALCRKGFLDKTDGRNPLLLSRATSGFCSGYAG